MKRVFWICAAGFVATLLLSTGLPLRNVSAVGQAATLTLYVLNPPALGVVLIAPHGAHELEESSWPAWEYSVMAAVSVVWWLCVGLGWTAFIRRRGTAAAPRPQHPYDP